MLHNIGASVTSLLLTITVAAAVQGSYMCSLRGDCSWAILHNTGMGPISLLRLLRVFRIMWILKHVRFMRISTLLGALAVRAHMARGAFGRGGWLVAAASIKTSSALCESCSTSTSCADQHCWAAWQCVCPRCAGRMEAGGEADSSCWYENSICIQTS
jgi:hypothetical protein